MKKEIKNLETKEIKNAKIVKGGDNIGASDSNLWLGKSGFDHV